MFSVLAVGPFVVSIKERQMTAQKSGQSLFFFQIVQLQYFASQPSILEVKVNHFLRNLSSTLIGHYSY